MKSQAPLTTNIAASLSSVLVRHGKWLGVLLFLAIFAGGQWCLQTGVVDAYYYRALVQICIFIIAAASLNLINGITGQFSLGHAGFMTVGGYTAAVLTRDYACPFPLALLAGAVLAGLLGIVVGLPTLRLRGDYLAIATIGMGEVVRVVFENIQRYGGPSGLSGIRTPAPLFGPAHFSLWGWGMLCCGLTLFCINQFIHSSHGRACIAIREDELAAETLGIRCVRYKVLAFCVGAAFAGVAGGLLAHLVRIVIPDQAGFLKSVEVLVMVVLGGLGSLTGTVFSAIFLTLVNFFTADLTVYHPNMAAWRMVIYALLLILVMLIQPQRLWRNWRRYRGHDHA